MAKVNPLTQNIDTLTLDGGNLADPTTTASGPGTTLPPWLQLGPIEPAPDLPGLNSQGLGFPELPPLPEMAPAAPAPHLTPPSKLYNTLEYLQSVTPQHHDLLTFAAPQVDRNKVLNDFWEQGVQRGKTPDQLLAEHEAIAAAPPAVPTTPVDQDTLDPVLAAIKKEMAAAPEYPALGKNQPINPWVAGLGIASALFDRRHAAENVAGILQGHLAAQNQADQEALAKYGAAEKEHQIRLGVLQHFGTLQESYLRNKALFAHYNQQDTQALRRDFMTNRKDPGAILYAGKELQRRLGAAGPTDDQINAAIRSTALPYIESLRKEIGQRAHGAYELNDEDRADLAERQQGLINMFRGTDGQPLLTKADIPTIPTSEQIQKVRADEESAHHQALEGMASERFKFAQTVAANREMRSWVELGMAQTRLQQADARLQLAQQAGRRDDMIALSTVLHRARLDTDKASEKLVKEADDKMRNLNAQVAKYQAMANDPKALRADRIKAQSQVAGIQAELQQWQGVKDETNLTRSSSGLPQYDPEQEKLADQIRQAISQTRQVNGTGGRMGEINTGDPERDAALRALSHPGLTMTQIQAILQLYRQRTNRTLF